MNRRGESDTADADADADAAEADPLSLPPGRSICLFCGEPEVLSLFEIWSDHNFQFETCCEGLLEHVSMEIGADPAWGRALLRQLGAEELTGHRLRRVSDGEGCTPMLDLNLQIEPIGFGAARAFIGAHHGHCAPPRGWRFGAAIRNGWSLLGVVTIGNPVAPALNRTGTVEVNRLCVRRDTAPLLRRDCCSKLYAWSAREAERRGFGRIITYVRADEQGTSLKAAGWVCEGPAGGRAWHSAKRSRSNVNAWIGKTRWSRTLKPKPIRTTTPRPPAPSAPSEWALAAGLEMDQRWDEGRGMRGGG